jgi:hypothetical protein
VQLTRRKGASSQSCTSESCMELDRKKYQAEIDGKNVDLYTIKNQKSWW